MKKYLFLFILFFQLGILNIHTYGKLQKNTDRKDINKPRTEKSFVKLKNNDTILSTNTEIKKNSKISIIVEMVEEPLFILRKLLSKRQITESDYEITFSQFVNDLESIKSNRLAKTNDQVNYSIRRKFHKIFNGISLDINKSMLNEINKLPYVKKIYLNNEVEALLDDSVPIIKADQVWQKYGIQGEGIIIGVLDTGIDYNHPAFGGGFGAGYKVIGGYDFVNNDNDPMDDHLSLHGSHVAGIIAADYELLKGIAPKAKLVVYKVLDADGKGTQDDIIAAITKCTDPNNDGFTDDKINIVNISLGGRGSADDPQSTAVNNASELGIIFCISAGNEGSNITSSIFGLKNYNYNNNFNYYSIGSPGTAEKAITVGGVKKDLSIYDNSSRGPIGGTFSLKPEIVAPGVNINSVGLNGGVDSHSGTSMAAPHVAGICALVKQIHPDWNADEIKSAVINNAVDLGMDLFTQGAGLADAIKSVETMTTLSPATLNFGNAVLSQSIYQKEEKIILHNMSTQAQNYVIDLNTVPPGVSITTAENNFNVLSNTVKELIFRIDVDKNNLPQTNNKSFSYSGVIDIKSNNDTLRVPWSVVNLETIKISYDDIFCYMYIYNNDHCLTNAQNLSASSGLFETELYLPAGQYGVLFDFYACDDLIHRWVLKDNISTSNPNTVNIESITGEQYSVEMNGVDKLGNRLSEKNNYKAVYTLIFPESSAVDYIYFESQKPFMKMSPFPQGYKILTSEYVVDFTQPGSVYQIQYDLKQGLNNNYTFSNTPEDLYKYNINIHFPDYITQKQLYFFNRYHYPTGGGANSFNNIVNNNFWYGSLYLTKPKQTDYLFNLTFELRDYDNYQFGQFYSSQITEFVGDNLFFTYDINNTNAPVSAYLAVPGGDFNFGVGPVYFKGEERIEINKPIGSQLTGSLKEWHRYEQNNARFSIFDNSYNILTEGLFKDINIPSSFDDNSNISFYNSKVINGELYANTSYTIYKDSLSKAEYFPQLNLLQVLNENDIPVGRIDPNKSSKCLFAITRIVQDLTMINEDNIKLKARRIGESRWQDIPISRRLDDTFNEAVFEGDLSSLTNKDSTAIELNIVYQEGEEEILEWKIKPAFIVGEYSVFTGSNSLIISQIGSDTTSINKVNKIDLPVSDLTGSELTFEAISDNQNVLTKIINDQLFLIPQNNWIGECNIHLTITKDQQTFEQDFSFVVTESTTGTEKLKDIIPQSYSLSQNYPNPFNPSTIIRYGLPYESKVSIKIYNILGQEIKDLVHNTESTGYHEATFNASKLASGIYFYRISVTSLDGRNMFVDTKKLLLLK